MRVAHFGSFDVANYGDQLFPLIFARHLDQHADVVHVSPTGRAAPWSDCASSVSFEAFRQQVLDVDAIVVGGGNLISLGSTPLRQYNDGELGANIAYPLLWLGAAEIAAARGLPLAWNAPGVPREFRPTGAELVSFAASACDFVSVRDVASRTYLRAAGVAGPIECSVDTAVEVGSLWSASALDNAYRALYRDRGREVPDRALALHIKERYLTEPLPALAVGLDRMASSLRATPVLLALGPCHGDARFLEELAQRMSSRPVVVGSGARLIDLAACIARAYAFVGSSLHGLITACAFGTPAVVVARELPGRFHKFSGFLEHVGDRVQLCSTWVDAEDHLRPYVSQGRVRWPRWEVAIDRLTVHWRRLVEATVTPLSPARRDQKTVGLQRCSRRIAAQYVPLGVVAGAVLEQSRDAVRDGRSSGPAAPSCQVRSWPSADVVVSVHNALHDVTACLGALLQTSGPDFRMLLINDGSDELTTTYLRAFANSHPRCLLQENSVAQGYTAAANRALSASTSDYVVLLNSDTIVPHDWLSKLLDCGEACGDVGAIGPLSNAAGWQSVPVVHATDGDWMVNQLPVGMTVDSMAALVNVVSGRVWPRVPLLNGFCLALKRRLIEAIGGFDCEISPHGYAEDIDFCLRAADAGFLLAIADTTYVYHAKSRSYGHAVRRALARAGKDRLQARYGVERLAAVRRELQENSVLAVLRSRLSAVLEAVTICGAGTMTQHPITGSGDS